MESNESDWWRFLHLCTAIKNIHDFDEFFSLTLTHEERAAISDRIKIIAELLQAKKTQREIAGCCHVSIAKITRGSNNLKTISEKLRKFLKRELK